MVMRDQSGVLVVRIDRQVVVLGDAHTGLPGRGQVLVGQLADGHEHTAPRIRATTADVSTNDRTGPAPT